MDTVVQECIPSFKLNYEQNKSLEYTNHGAFLL